MTTTAIFTSSANTLPDGISTWSEFLAPVTSLLAEAQDIFISERSEQSLATDSSNVGCVKGAVENAGLIVQEDKSAPAFAARAYSETPVQYFTITKP